MSSYSCRFAALVTLFCAGTAGAVTLEVVGPCAEEPAVLAEVPLERDDGSVGAFTVRAFDRLGVPYVGNERGMSSILGTPTGADAYEILDEIGGEGRMRAYGWCYSVNGKFPPVMAHEARFGADSDRLLWIFGYTTYDRGEWIGYCDPAHEVHSAEKERMFCGK